jgi:anti-sigma factor (TIGR02949 family)
MVYSNGQNCARTWKYLEYYLSDELSIEATLEVTRHLEVCRGCLAEIQRRGQVRDRLRTAVQGEAVPADLRGKVARIVRHSNRADLDFLA